MRDFLSIVTCELLAAGAGCSDECEPFPCPDYYVERLTASAADTEFALALGEQTEPQPVLISEPWPTDSVPACWATADARWDWFDVDRRPPPERPQIGKAVEETAIVQVSCTTEAIFPGSRGTGIYFSDIVLGDLRMLDPGTYAPLLPLVLHYDSKDTSCTIDLDPDGILITIEEATGGAAPYPSVVTSDYSRVVRVDVSYPGPLTGPSCAGSVAVVGHTTFRYTAESYTSVPDAMCTPSCGEE
jgi:hypothetical protein